MQLSPKQLESYLSPYLLHGWKKDHAILKSASVEQSQIRGTWQMQEFFIPSDGRFHLTVPLSFIWVAQLAIIYVCWENGFSRKPGEIYLREINIQCKKAIYKKEIGMLLTCKGKRRIGTTSIVYRGSFDIDDGSFVGEATFVCPFPNQKENTKEDNYGNSK